MGNSYCCSSGVKKEELIRKSDILIEREKKFEKLSHYRKENKSDKTISTFFSKNEEASEFVNPLPEIVIIKMKKNHKKHNINL